MVEAELVPEHDSRKDVSRTRLVKRPPVWLLVLSGLVLLSQIAAGILLFQYLSRAA